MARKLIVVVACHFKNKDELCTTTLERLKYALSLARNTQTIFMVTGPVPYQKGGKTLGQLMKEYLLANGVPENMISISEGVGIFSEARDVCYKISSRSNQKDFKVVSSDWYFIPGGKIWRHFARLNDLRIETVEVYDTGGAKTRLIYLIYGILAHLSFLFGLENKMEKFMSKLQAGRKESFKLNGCG